MSVLELDVKAALIATGLALVFFALWQKRKTFSEPKLFFSDIGSFGKATRRAASEKLPKRLLWAAFAAFTLGFIDPHVYLDVDQNSSQKDSHSNMPVEGIGIYLVLDRSGSMKEKIDAGGAQISKVDLLRSITREFIAGDSKMKLPGRPNDMIGLVAFARGASVLSPLTLDHNALLQELARFAPVLNRDDDGTSIGYAIFKTANMIAATRHYAEELISKGKPAYTIQEMVMILITDGLQDPNPLDKGKRLRNIDIEEAAAYAKEQKIRLYIVNVEPKLSSKEFAPHRHIMQRAAENTGGKFFMINNTGNLKEIYAEIDRLEKSRLPAETLRPLDKALSPDQYKRVSFYPYLVAFGLAALFVGLILDCTAFRRVP